MSKDVIVGFLPACEIAVHAEFNPPAVVNNWPALRVLPLATPYFSSWICSYKMLKTTQDGLMVRLERLHNNLERVGWQRTLIVMSWAPWPLPADPRSIRQGNTLCTLYGL